MPRRVIRAVRHLYTACGGRRYRWVPPMCRRAECAHKRAVYACRWNTLRDTKFRYWECLAKPREALGIKKPPEVTVPLGVIALPAVGLAGERRRPNPCKVNHLRSRHHSHSTLYRTMSPETVVTGVTLQLRGEFGNTCRGAIGVVDRYW